ncbi:P-type type IV conjugative transfer system protein TrbF/VirB8 [Candidatus Campylobacter infans]|uniref:P-type type IV conjugative transfer system protein TrbF/VirB8 n=1 Tax=Candidatus Campylobacter infans TaxID=2561898 RepID=A0A7H9CIE2_9BACT|nr:VirB8/TrbF family protein [Candidatus Campylobacter infans]QLI05135.1 P-type type IV conjugative transfer system protein TrbF/VirB8 [Candidatus Campylobacter infans]
MILNEPKKDPNFLFKLERNIKAYMLYIIMILGVSVILLAGAIIAIAPLKEVKPYLMFFSDGDTNFVKVKPATLDVRSDLALLKSILAGYVKNREKINRIDDIQRYETTRIQSKKEVWVTFQNIVKNPNSIYATSNITREIRIVNVSILQKNIAQVDYVATVNNITKSDKDEITKWRATLEFDFKEVMDTYNSTIKNPTGFQVLKYAVEKVDDFVKKDNK